MSGHVLLHLEFSFNFFFLKFIQNNKNYRQTHKMYYMLFACVLKVFLGSPGGYPLGATPQTKIKSYHKN